MDYSIVITTASLISALVVIFSAVFAVTRWVQRQIEQDQDIKRTKEEQELLTRGVLACLKGLKEKGCDGPVEDAIEEIEKFLNRAAHQ